VAKVDPVEPDRSKGLTGYDTSWPAPDHAPPLPSCSPRSSYPVVDQEEFEAQRRTAKPRTAVRFRPPPQTVVEEGDVVSALTTPQSVVAVHHIISGSRTSQVPELEDRSRCLTVLGQISEWNRPVVVRLAG
jgi:hypothetical protein